MGSCNRAAWEADMAEGGGEYSSEVFEIDGPRLKPSLRHLMPILLPDPLAFSSALATVGSMGDSEGVTGVAPAILAEEETKVGLEILKAPPRLVFFRPREAVVEGVLFNAAVAAAIRASKSRRTSGSSSGATFLDPFRLSALVEGVLTTSSTGVSSGTEEADSAGGGGAGRRVSVEAALRFPELGFRLTGSGEEVEVSVGRVGDATTWSDSLDGEWVSCDMDG